MIRWGDDPLDQVGAAIEAIVDEEELIEGEDQAEKPEEVNRVTEELNTLIISCLAQRGSSRKTRSNRRDSNGSNGSKSSKRKTKKRKLKSCLTRRKGKKAQTE
jgi:hypothetical protein